MGEVLQFKNSVEIYKRIADKKSEEGDLASTLGFLFKAEKESSSLSVISDIADVYADMGLLEESNAYWFKYLSKAPKEKMSVAYGELAINYFYLDNLFASAYYFDKKVSADGFISKDGLDDEVLEFIDRFLNNKKSYHIAYPFDRADFSEEIKRGKTALSFGDVETASKIYLSIPRECMDEETSGDATASCFLCEKTEEALEICKDSIKNNGENVTAYCDMSSIYKIKGDEEKSAYYYEKALSLKKGNKSEAYKLVAVAVEREDHNTVRENIELILPEREFDVNIRLFYGISLINTFDYEKAKENFVLINKICPHNPVFEYYLNLCCDLVKKVKISVKLPLKYQKDLPQKVIKEHKDKVMKIAVNSEAIKSFIKTEQGRSVLKYGIYSKDKEFFKKVMVVLAESNTLFARELFLSVLMSSEVTDEVKEFVIYCLLRGGYKESFCVLGGCFLVKIKPAKFLFNGAYIGEDKYLLSYGLCVAKLSVLGVEDFDKVVFSINKIYNIFCIKKNLEEDFSVKELSALTVNLCKFDNISTADFVCKLFGVKRRRFSEISKMLKE